MKNIVNILFALFLFSSNHLSAQSGCTDPLATNYNASATQNDGTCVYGAASVAPFSSFYITSNLIETSGLLYWNKQFWSHNDNGDTYLYTLDTLDGSLQQVYNLTGTVNTDWEEIADDSSYIYLGDFGNSLNGNRTDLKILRIDKSSLLLNSPLIDTIAFSYPDQVSFNPTGSNNTDFDCEAMVVSTDSIYLFTKQWITHQTKVYAVAKVAGNHIATYKTIYNVQGLITGAVALPNKSCMVLCGYTDILEPFFYLLYDYNGTNYFSGNVRKVNIALPFHQVEGVTTTNGTLYYFTNENFMQGSLNIPQQLHALDMSSYLSNYLNSLTGLEEKANSSGIHVFPNPVSNILGFKTPTAKGSYQINDCEGKTILRGAISNTQTFIQLSTIKKGVYYLTVNNEHGAYSSSEFVVL